jgi:hypothetical protein
MRHQGTVGHDGREFILHVSSEVERFVGAGTHAPLTTGNEGVDAHLGEMREGVDHEAPAVLGRET